MSALAVLPPPLRRAGRRWRQWRHRLGPVGLAGAFLLLLGVAALGYAPLLRDQSAVLEREAQALRSELQATPQRARAADADGAEAVQALPTLMAMTDDMRALFAAAGRHQVDLPRGDYALTHLEDGSGLARLEIVLPVKERYATLKAFVADLLNQMPHASLSELRLERSAAGVQTLEARVRLTLYYRER